MVYHQNHGWTPERVDLLRARIAEGKSVKEIGREFGKSRNAIIGKAHRMGFYWSDPRSTAPATPPPEPVKAAPIRIEPVPGKDPALCVMPGCTRTKARQNPHRLCPSCDQKRIAEKRKAA